MTHPTPWPNFQFCQACGSATYLPRNFCPTCGSRSVESRRASGAGTVSAVTAIHRAPEPHLEPLAPYVICLIEADEGFRFMAHGALDLSIGDHVVANLFNFGGRLLPKAEREPQYR